MKVWHAVVALAVGFVGTVLAVPGTAHACSCVALAPQSVIEQSDAVVLGTAVEVREETNSRTYVVEVKQSYRQRVPARIEVRTPSQSAACGVELTLGQERFLVLSAPVDGPADPTHWRASLCSNLMSADDIHAYAGAPLAPVGALDSANDDGPGELSAGVIAGIVVGAVGGLVVLAAAGVAVARRFR